MAPADVENNDHAKRVTMVAFRTMEQNHMEGEFTVAAVAAGEVPLAAVQFWEVSEVTKRTGKIHVQHGKKITSASIESEVVEFCKKVTAAFVATW